MRLASGRASGLGSEQTRRSEVSVASDCLLFARFLLCPEDSGAQGHVRQLCGSRCAALLKTAFWALAAVAVGLALGRLN